MLGKIWTEILENFSLFNFFNMIACIKNTAMLNWDAGLVIHFYFIFTLNNKDKDLVFFP